VAHEAAEGGDQGALGERGGGGEDQGEAERVEGEGVQGYLPFREVGFAKIW